jgi:FixJ family two-component response regulator
MPDTAPIVYILDNDISVRESLEGMVRQAGWQPLLFSSARDFLIHRHGLGPSCLILDVSLPDLDGLDLQRKVAGERADMPIIFFTGNGDVPTTVLAMKAGAAEFLTKPVDGEVLLEAIRNALDRSVSALGTASELQVLKDRYASLSTREREVMTLVVTGLMNKQVGGKLGISEITVKAHRGRMMQKMRARSLADLVNIAARLGVQEI